VVKNYDHIPKYDAEYVAKADKGPVRVLSNNWRRKITVDVQGGVDALDAAYRRIIFAALID
jgi:hypothetical protein